MLIQSVGWVNNPSIYPSPRLVPARSIFSEIFYGPGIDFPVIMIDAASGNKYYYAHDAQGSVVALLNDTGAVVEAYSDGPFGETYIRDGAGGDNKWLTSDDSFASPKVSAYGNPYMYTARRYDNESGLYYYRFRHYSTKIKRFIQPDPIGYGDGLNIYTYCRNNAASYIDPFGLKAFTRAETIEFINKTMGSGWSPLHHLKAAEPYGKLEIGRYDFKYSGHTFDVPEYGKMTGSEFGNYIAGYLAKVNWGRFGSGGMRLGGHLYAFGDAWGRSIASAFGFCKTPNYSDYLDDPISRRDIQCGVDHAIRVLDSVNTGALPPVDPDNFGGIYYYGDWLENKKGS